MVDANSPQPAILFRRLYTKGQQNTREVAMNEQLACYLVAYQPGLSQKYLYLGRHGRSHIRIGPADLILRKAFKRVGVSGFSTYGFRRTALTRMHNAGVPTKHIQRISSHRALAALSGYLEVTDE